MSLNLDQRIAIARIAVTYMASFSPTTDEKIFLENLKKYSDLIEKQVNPNQLDDENIRHP
jgi:hypothetical protein